MCEIQLIIRALDGILQHKRYLLVINDTSTREEWNSIKLYLRPDIKNANRIIVTSLDEGVARYCAGGLTSSSFCLSVGTATLPAFCNMELVADEPAEACSNVSNPESIASTSSEIVEITVCNPENIAQRARDRISRTIARDEEVPQLVGREKEMDWLVSAMTDTNNEQNNVIPICGMRGIGKTALVRNAYCHQDVIDHFTHRAWVTVSYPLNKGNLFHNILQHFKSNDNNSYLRRPLQEMYIEELIEFYEVNKRTCHFRCLVVVDGLSTTQAWNLVKSSLLLEDYKALLRIIVTTRELQVAKYCSNTDFVYNLSRLSENDASELFCLKAFGRATEVKLSAEMVKQKYQMLDKCGGIPFAIVDVCQLVAYRPFTAREWESINKNIKLYQ
ncbi:putative disease resistance protein At1g50180 isoform X2 [Panicum virgatum]|nr:putative disease resistance protein At1g50180 isoform X2 [Panicum virgatum]